MQTTLSVNEVAERLGIHPRSVRNLESKGTLHRLPLLPGVRFSAAEVHKIESIGKDAEAMSAWERKLKDEKIASLEARVAELEQRIFKMMQIGQGGAI